MHVSVGSVFHCLYSFSFSFSYKVQSCSLWTKKGRADLSHTSIKTSLSPTKEKSPDLKTFTSKGSWVNGRGHGKGNHSVFGACFICIVRVTRVRVTRMAYSPRIWLMAIGWWNKINQCRKLKLNPTQTWGVCMTLDSGMHWSQNQWYCDDKPRKE